MKKRFLTVLLAILLVCSIPFALLACVDPVVDPPVSDPGAKLTGLYATGNDEETMFETSSYTVYNHSSQTASTSASTGIAAVNENSSFRVTKEATEQTWESVFWRVSEWNINKHLQFSVTVKNNLSTPVNVRILLASVDGVDSNLGKTNIHHGDGFATDTNYTLGGNSSRTYRVTQDPDALYSVVDDEEKSIKAVYMRFNTHGTMLGAADVTITKMTLKEAVNEFNIGDFTPLYGSKFHRTLTSNYNEGAKTLSSALYMGATSAYSETNHGFDSQTSAWNASSDRYLHYKLVNVSDDETNLKEYGVSLQPVKGTGQTAASIGDDVHKGFTESAQTVSGVIDLNDYSGFTTLRIMINDREGNENNKEIPDGIYVAIEVHIMYSNSATAAFGTLPNLNYTIPAMPVPPTVIGDGDMTGLSGTAVSVTDKATVEVTESKIVTVGGQIINKLVVTAEYEFITDFNKDNDNWYAEFAGITVDLTDFISSGLTFNYKFTNKGAAAVRVSAKVPSVSNTSGANPDGGTKTTLSAGASATRSSALGIGQGEEYTNLTSFRMYLGGNAGESGTVELELWFILPVAPDATFGVLGDGNGEGNFNVASGTVTLNAAKAVSVNGGKIVKMSVTDYSSAKKYFNITFTNNGDTDIAVRIILKSAADEWGDGLNGQYGLTVTVEAGQTLDVQTETLSGTVGFVFFGFGDAADYDATINELDVTISNYNFGSVATPAA